MKYDAAGWWGRAVVQSSHITDSESKALRHARAMKAVLLAAKAWAKRWPRDRTLDEQRAYEIATARLLGAQARLAKIEKEVARG